MPSFSKSLEAALHRALEYANDRNHEYATLEHLLLSLLDDRDAAAVMRACNVEVDALRRRITDYLDQELLGLVIKGHTEAARPPAFSASCIAPSSTFSLRGVKRLPVPTS